MKASRPCLRVLAYTLHRYMYLLMLDMKYWPGVRIIGETELSLEPQVDYICSSLFRMKVGVSPSPA